MRHPRLEPKHVRNFFYEHAVTTRLIELLFDLIWGLISVGLGKIAAQIWWRIQALLPTRLRIDERTRKLHTLIVGRTGVGKSVLLHHLIRHYQTKNTRPSVIVLDPHGDLAEFVARDKINLRHRRLVLIRPSGIGGSFASLNPFEIANTDEHLLNRAQIQFAGAVEQIIGEAFTPRQRTLIRACMGVMLHKPGASLLDLIRLLQDGNNADLVRYGQSQLPNPVDRQFFLASFAEPGYHTTKLALISRLVDIVRDPTVRAFTCQRSTFNLPRLLDSGHLIIVQFNPAKQSSDTIRAIGQLLCAAIFSHVIGRPQNKRYPIHMFVDECQYFVSATVSDMLGEARKFGLYLTLATQRIEALTQDIQDSVLSNVGTFWIGNSRHVTAEKLAKETPLNSDDIRTLRRLEFYQIADNRPPKKTRVKFIGLRHAMPFRQWNSILKSQSKRYYGWPKSTRKNVRPPARNRHWEPPKL